MSKKRPPKDPAKAAKWRAKLATAGEYKKAKRRQELGSNGAASSVRKIDPASYQSPAMCGRE
jgi:hypothetical protein